MIVASDTINTKSRILGSFGVRNRALRNDRWLWLAPQRQFHFDHRLTKALIEQETKSKKKGNESASDRNTLGNRNQERRPGGNENAL